MAPTMHGAEWGAIKILRLLFMLPPLLSLTNPAESFGCIGMDGS